MAGCSPAECDSGAGSYIEVAVRLHLEWCRDGIAGVVPGGVEIDVAGGSGCRTAGSDCADRQRAGGAGAAGSTDYLDAAVAHGKFDAALALGEPGVAGIGHCRGVADDGVFRCGAGSHRVLEVGADGMERHACADGIAGAGRCFPDSAGPDRATDDDTCGFYKLVDGGRCDHARLRTIATAAGTRREFWPLSRL